MKGATFGGEYGGPGSGFCSRASPVSLPPSCGGRIGLVVSVQLTMSGSRLHEAHIVEDRVIDAVWRAPISMTNRTRRPRVLPVFAERATVRAGHRVHLAVVCLENDAMEVNPDDVALAWVEVVLPASQSARVVDAAVMQTRPRTLRFVCLPGASIGHSRTPTRGSHVSPTKSPMRE